MSNSPTGSGEGEEDMDSSAESGGGPANVMERRMDTSCKQR
jgi:hypothetical protein